MLRVGLTGGLASGKSTVAGFFRELGAFHVDADAIAHALTAPGGGAHPQVVARFGTADRKAIAATVFGDARARADLNAIVHPLIREEIARTLERERPEIALIDAALLVETGMHEAYDALVVVSCSPETQLARAVARGMTEDQAKARIAAQAPLEDKVAQADFVIDTDTSLHDTRAQVRDVWETLKRRGDSFRNSS